MPEETTRTPMPDRLPSGERLVHWDPQMPWPKERHLVLTARTFQPWVDSCCPWKIKQLMPVEHVTECKVAGVDFWSVGNWKLYRRTFQPWYWHEKQPFCGFSLADWEASRKPTGWYRSSLDLLKQVGAGEPSASTVR